MKQFRNAPPTDPARNPPGMIHAMKTNLRIMLSLLVALFGSAAGCSGPGGGPEHTSRRLILHSQVAFKTDQNGSKNLVINNAGMSLNISWSSGSGKDKWSYFPVALKSKDDCIFIVEFEHLCGQEHADDAGPEDLGFFTHHHPRLVRIYRDDKVIYDEAICEIHKRRMDHKNVPIHYGMNPPIDYFPPRRQMEKLFPHYEEYVVAGCIQFDRTTKFIYVCPDCKAAFAKWRKENPDPAP